MTKPAEVMANLLTVLRDDMTRLIQEKDDLLHENERLKKQVEGLRYPWKNVVSAADIEKEASRAAFKRAEHLVAMSVGLRDALDAIRAEGEK